MLTVRDLADLLKVDEKTVYRMAQRGDLPGFKVSGSWRFEESDIRSWIDQRKMAAGGTQAIARRTTKKAKRLF